MKTILLKTLKSSVLLSSVMYASTVGTIKEDANIREEASLKSKIKEVALKNDKVLVIKILYTKNNGTWYETDKGYVSSELIEIKSVNVNSKEVLVYSLPSTNSPLVTKLVQSDVVKQSIVSDEKLIRGYDYPWFKIEQGWVNVPYLKYEKPIKPLMVITKEEPKEIKIDEIKNNSNDTLAQEEDKTPIIVKSETVKENKLLTRDDKQYFVGLTLGYTNINISQNDKVGSFSLSEEQEENGYNLTFELGYNYSSLVDIILNYQRVQLNDVHLDNVSLESNYKLNSINEFIPYIGVSVGYSFLTWDKKPIPTINNDYSSNSYLLGSKLGIIYKLINNIDINLNYQLQYMNQKANLESKGAKSEIVHDYTQSLNIGLRVPF